MPSRPLPRGAKTGSNVPTSSRSILDVLFSERCPAKINFPRALIERSLLSVRSRPSRPEQVGDVFGKTLADEVASAESTTRIVDTGRRSEAGTVRRASSNDVAHVEEHRDLSTENNKETSGLTSSRTLPPRILYRVRGHRRAIGRAPAVLR